MSHTYQILNKNKHSRIGSAIGERLSDILLLVDDRFQKPLEVSFKDSVLTVAAGIVQSIESDEIGGFQNSYKYGLSPMTGDENKPVESTLNLSTGAFTGDFQSASSPLMTPNYYIRMGIELRTDGKLYAIFGDEAASLAGATYPKFAVGGSIQILTVDLQDDGTGGAWNFIEVNKEDITILVNSSTGGGGASNAKLIEGGLWDVVSTFVTAETILQGSNSTLLLAWENPTDEWGQSFTPNVDGYVESIRINISKVGNPDADLVLELRNVTLGLPTTVIGSKTIHSSLVSGDTYFTFDSPIPVSALTKYAFTLRYDNVTLVDGSNRYLVYGLATNPYADGEYLENTGAWAYSGTEDAFFQATIVEDKYELTWSADAYISYPGVQPARNRIVASSAQLEIGEAAYVRINKLPGGNENLTVEIDTYENIDPYDAKIVIFARSVTDGVIVGSSFLLVAGASKYLDAGLSEENKSLLGGITEADSLVDYSSYGSPERNIDSTQNIPTAISSLDTELDKFFGQLKLIPHEIDVDKVRVTGVDFTMKDGSILSQEIASLLMKFEGAVIDFTTGEIFEDDGVTPLGVDFTPTVIPASEYNWYSVGLVANTLTALGEMTVQLIILSGTPDADENLATLPSFAGSKKVGLVKVKNNGGSIQQVAIRQLGAGGGGSGGGAGSNAKLLSGGDWSFIPPTAENIIHDTGSSIIVQLNLITQRIGQSITPTVNGKLTQFKAWISDTGGEYEFVAKVAPFSGGIPDEGSAVTSEVKTQADVVADPGGYVTFNFPTPMSLVAGTQYAIYIQLTNIISGTMNLGVYGGSTPYAGGSVWYQLGGGWTEYAARDLRFQCTIVGAGELAWNEDAYVALPGLQYGRNTIPAGSIGIGDNYAAYVKLNSLSGLDDNLTVYSDDIENISPYDSSIYIFARGINGEVIVGGASTKILPHTRRQLEDNSDVIFFEDVTFDETIESSLVFEANAIIGANARIKGNVTFLGTATIKKGAVIVGNVSADDSETSIRIETGAVIQGSISTPSRTMFIDSTNSTTDETIDIYGNVHVDNVIHLFGTGNRYHTLNILGDVTTNIFDISNNTSTSADMLNTNIHGNIVCSNLNLGGSSSNTTRKVNTFYGDVIVSGSITSTYSNLSRGSDFIAKGNVTCGNFTFRTQDTVTGFSQSNTDIAKIEISGDLIVNGNLSIGHNRNNEAHKIYGDVYVNGDIEIYGANNSSAEGSIIFYSNVKVKGDLNYKLFTGTTVTSRLNLKCFGEFSCKNISKDWQNTWATFYIGGTGIVKALSASIGSGYADKKIEFIAYDINARPAIEIHKNVNSEVVLKKYNGTELLTILSTLIKPVRYNWNHDLATPLIYGKDYTSYDAIVDELGNGDYTTIAAASQALGTDKTIFIRNGNYTIDAALTLKHGTRIIGESMEGVRITLTQRIEFPAHFSDSVFDVTQTLVDGLLFDPDNGPGLLTFNYNTITCVYSGDADPVIGHKIFFCGNWYNISNVDTLTKTITLDKRIFAQTAVGVPYFTCQASTNIEEEQFRRPCCIENVTFVNNQNVRGLYLSRVIGARISNVRFLALDSHTNGGYCIELDNTFQIDIDNVKAVSEVGGTTTFTSFIKASRTWYSRLTNIDCYNVPGITMSNGSVDTTTYRCSFHFSRLTAAYGILTPQKIIECDFKFDKVVTYTFCNSAQSFYKCRFEFGSAHMADGTTRLRGNGNEFHFGDTVLTYGSKALDVTGTNLTYLPNKIISGKITGTTLYANKTLWISESVDVSGLLFNGQPGRLPEPDKYDAIVDINGTGTFTSIKTAVDTMPAFSKIFIKDGEYTETASITLKTGQKLHGESRKGTIIKTTVVGSIIYFPTSSSLVQTRPATDNKGFNSVDSHGTCSVTIDSRTVTYTGSTDPVSGRHVFIEGNWFTIVSVDSGLKTFELNRDWEGPTATGLPFRTLVPATGASPATSPDDYTEISNFTIETTIPTNQFITANSSILGRINKITVLNKHVTNISYYFVDLLYATDFKIDDIKLVRLNTNASEDSCCPFRLQAAWYCDITNMDIYNFHYARLDGTTTTGPVYKCNIELDRVHTRLLFLTSNFVQQCNISIKNLLGTQFSQSSATSFYKCKFKFGEIKLVNTSYIQGLANTLDVHDFYGNLYFNCHTLTPDGLDSNHIRSGRFHSDVNFGTTPSVIVDDPVEFASTSGTPKKIPAKSTYTTVVDASGRGDYTSIAAALAGSPNGATIYVRNGTYNETVVGDLKPGQKLIGESRDGVKVTSSGTYFLNVQSSYDTYSNTHPSSSGDGFDPNAEIGTIDVVVDSTTATYSGTGTTPVAGRHAFIEGSWFSIDSVDTIGKTIELSRPWSGETQNGLPWVMTRPTSLSNLDLNTNPDTHCLVENITYTLNVLTNIYFIYCEQGHNLRLRNLTVINNGMSIFSPFYFYRTIGLDIDGLKLISKRDGFNGVTQLDFRNLRYSKIVNVDAYAGVSIELYTASNMNYKNIFHIRHIEIGSALFGYCDNVYDCEFKFDYADVYYLAQESTSNMRFNRCKFIFGKLRTTSNTVNAINGIGNEFHFGHTDITGGLRVKNVSAVANAPKNIFADGHLKMTGTLYIDSNAWLGDTVDLSYGALDGVWGRAPFDPTEVLDDLDDVDTTGKEDGQALVYSDTLSMFVPGPSGDSSFKLQSISSDGTELKIKKGSIILNDGRILHAAADLTDDVTTKATSDGDWSAFIDLYTLGSPSIVDNRRVYTITTANFVYFNKYLDDSAVDLVRYIPRGGFDRTGGVYSGVTTSPYLIHDLPLGADASLVASIEYREIKSVGDFGQFNSGHVLDTTSFRSALIGSDLSWWNLNDMFDDSGNGRTFSNNNSATFGTGIIGDLNSAVVLNGSNQFLSRVDSFFDGAGSDFAVGGWFNLTNWANGVGWAVLFGLWDSVAKSYVVRVSASGVLYLYASYNGTNVEETHVDIASFTGWHHISIKHIVSTNTMSLYVDGVKAAPDLVISGSLYSHPSPIFRIGVAYDGPVTYLDGKVDEFFFCKGAIDDNDIMRIQSAKYTHNKGLSSIAQGWEWWAKSANGNERPLEYSPISHIGLNEVFFDLSAQEPTNLIAAKLFNRNQTGVSKPNKGNTLTLTTDQLDAALPYSHELGVVPELSFKVHNGTDYEGQDWGSVFKVNSAQIKIAGDSLVTLFGSGVNVILTYSAGIPVSFVPNRFWNVRQVSVTSSISTNDRVIADVTGGNITLYLPPNPSIGDECQVLHGDTPFSPTAYVSFDSNGNPLRGGTGGFDCTVPNKLYKAIYVGGTYGWDILY